ncbi:MAG TPA: RodZ domain-containing protein [Lysobacter sp.]|nr:RodZ domain-containing protein [Lysobacter sp.]
MMQSYDVARGGLGQFGARLKQAREAAGLSLDQVSVQLHLPRHVLEALEADDHSRLGAPVFVRGQLRSYARLLNLDLQPELETLPVANGEPAPLVSHVHTPRYRRLLEQATRRAIYVVLTGAIAVPVWLATRPHLDRDFAVQSLDALPVDAVPAQAQPAPAAPRVASAPQGEPLVASLAALPPSQPAATARELAVQFKAESWVEVQAADGRTIERGLVPAGESRRYRPGEIAQVVIGNVSAVDVRNAGQVVDLAPFSRANVARFTLSSDGSLAPVGN